MANKTNAKARGKGKNAGKAGAPPLTHAAG